MKHSLATVVFTVAVAAVAAAVASSELAAPGRALAAPPPSDFAPIEPLPSAPPPEAPPAPPDVAAPPESAQRTGSGLAFKVLRKGGGGGAHPSAWDRVTVAFTGWTADGKSFDSTVTRGEPWTLALDNAIAGWTEGIQLMTKGEKRRFWIPSRLAYGDRPARPTQPAGDLVYDVELLDFVKLPEPPAVPPDLDGPPAGAKKTASGLAYVILKHGKGKVHPKPNSTVDVHYSGWTPDGKLFDSSVLRGQPATFPLDGVIKGWTEGLQLLVPGDKARFWIPGKLAYGDKPSRPGAPAGPLVFDVELLSIK